MISSFIHDLSLSRENIIVIEKLFTSVEVLTFDSLLSGSDRSHHHSRLESFIAEFLIEVLGGLRSEADEKLIL